MKLFNVLAAGIITLVGWADDVYGPFGQDSDIAEDVQQCAPTVYDVTLTIRGKPAKAGDCIAAYRTSDNALCGLGMAYDSGISGIKCDLVLYSFKDAKIHFKVWQCDTLATAATILDADPLCDIVAPAPGTVGVPGLNLFVAHETFTVTFDRNANDAEGTMAAQTFTADVAQALRDNSFTRTGYTFKGWTTNANGNVVYTDKQSIKISASMTLYANWTVDTYPVVFDANGGAVSPASKTVTYDSTYGDLPVPTWADHIFVSWFTVENGGTRVTESDKVTITAAQTLYAHWVAPDEPGPQSGEPILDIENGMLIGVDLNGVTEVFIPSSVRGIGNYAFWQCDVIKRVTIPDSVTSIGDQAFYYCTNLTDVTIGNSVVRVGNEAFAGCSKLTNVTLPESLTHIGYGAFVECHSLTRMKLPDGVTGIGQWTFGSCKSLKDVIIPSSTKYVLHNVFTGCSGLKYVIFEGDAPDVDETAFDIDSNCVVFVPRSSTGWGNAIPGKWHRLRIEYIDSMPNVLFAKAQTKDGVLYDKENNFVGIVQLKFGKINVRKGTVKVSATATLLKDGKVKRITAKAVTVTFDAQQRVPLVKMAFKAPIGDMTFEMVADGSFTLKNDSYLMAEVAVGGTLKKGGSQGTFRMKGFDLAVPGELLDCLLPYEEEFSAAGNKWKFAKAATVKWFKPKKVAALPEIYDEASGKGLVVDKAGGKTNLSSLKLSYTAKTGQFKGSFKAYALEGAGKSTKLKKYTVNVIGFVVDGVGHGEASCKRPAGGPWPVTVK